MREEHTMVYQSPESVEQIQGFLFQNDGIVSDEDLPVN
jgi:hypothetical protein